MMEQYRERLKDKKRIVVKIGSSSLQHPETGDLDYIKLEVLVRELCNLKNQGKDVVLVTSGAIAQGKKVMHLREEDINEHNRIAIKQACAAIGQSRLMMTYERIFSEYNQVTAQILMTKNTIVDDLNRYNAHNTFSQLLQMGVIPVVNENDTVATYELEMDNDTLSAIVAALIDADLLILLSDIDGLYTDDPRKNPDAEFVEIVEELQDGFQGIPEPVVLQGRHYETGKNSRDLILMPGTAFDRQRRRLGYGGGFYDRFCRRAQGAARIALCFDCQLLEELPEEETDIRPERIVTESGWI